MFDDEFDFAEFPKNPAVDNEEAIRRAAQVFYILENWAGVYLNVQDGKLSPEEAVDQFNELVVPIGMAYDFEFQIGPDFMDQVIDAYRKIIDALARVDEKYSEEN